jgi:hypothetical protein
VTVSFAEREGEWEIWTPDLRLVFVRLGDRWTHRIDIGPGLWQTLAEAVEWTTAAEDPLRVVSPVYQEVQVQRDGDAVIALAVGQAGPHHFSLSARVSYGVYEARSAKGLLNAYPKSLVVFDVADRCRAEVVAFECRYRVLNPPAVSYLGDSSDETPAGFSPRPRPYFLWEANTSHNYDVGLSTKGSDGPPAFVSIVDYRPEVWTVRVFPESLVRGGTNRVRYSWSQTRVFLPSDPRPPGPIVPRSHMNP